MLIFDWKFYTFYSNLFEHGVTEAWQYCDKGIMLIKKKDWKNLSAQVAKKGVTRRDIKKTGEGRNR